MKRNNFLAFVFLWGVFFSASSFAEEFATWGEAWHRYKAVALHRAKHVAKRECLHAFGKVKHFTWCTTCHWFGSQRQYQCTASVQCKDRG